MKCLRENESEFHSSAFNKRNAPILKKHVKLAPLFFSKEQNHRNTTEPFAHPYCPVFFPEATFEDSYLLHQVVEKLAPNTQQEAVS